ncbi:hypothetical protein [Chelatococcus sp. XZ-Ab1]|uniref:hypothetical protein n=1 Tax=Chelatococcus sp. XZ-Ab1 TaxID=3034027 RepID=UPI0023E461CC|nr:hypothetical protein [Chelatococcus sp. XZ-Ab1]
MSGFAFYAQGFENSEHPCVIRDDPAGGDPHVLCTVRRIHNPGALNELCAKANTIEPLTDALATAQAFIQAYRDEVFASVTVGGDAATMDDIDKPIVEEMDALLATIDAALSAAREARQ